MNSSFEKKVMFDRRSIMFNYYNRDIQYGTHNLDIKTPKKANEYLARLVRFGELSLVKLFLEKYESSLNGDENHGSIVLTDAIYGKRPSIIERLLEVESIKKVLENNKKSLNFYMISYLLDCWKESGEPYPNLDILRLLLKNESLIKNLQSPNYKDYKHMVRTIDAIDNFPEDLKVQLLQIKTPVPLYKKAWGGIKNIISSLVSGISSLFSRFCSVFKKNNNSNEETQPEGIISSPAYNLADKAKASDENSRKLEPHTQGSIPSKSGLGLK